MAFKSYYKLVKYQDPRRIPFYVEDISGAANTVSITRGNHAPALTIQTSFNGINWTTAGTTNTRNPLNISIPANGRVYMRCNATAWGANSYFNIFNASTGDFNVGGNIMSLLYGSNFTGSETSFPSGSTQYVFNKIFSPYGTLNLISASELVLPATTLIEYCYTEMFRNCTSLTTPPAIFPATTLVEGSYYCMFLGCTSLTSAPVLPATTLATYCYDHMFCGCTSLNSVTCLATDISASQCTHYWLYDVAANGTFTKAASMSSWTTGVSGIPSGWTVQDA